MTKNLNFNVSIDSGPVSHTDNFHDLPVQKWRNLTSERRDFIAINAKYLCQQLIQYVQDAQEMSAELGYKNQEDFLENGLEITQEEVALAQKWLQIRNQRRIFS